MFFSSIAFVLNVRGRFLTSSFFFSLFPHAYFLLDLPDLIWTGDRRSARHVLFGWIL